MKIQAVFLLFLATFVSCAAASSSSESSSLSSSSASTTLVTLIWVTITRSDGALATVETPYSQSFATFYSEVATVPSGSIGIGSISGTVGEIRTYLQTTINAAPKLGVLHNDSGFSGSRAVYFKAFVALIAMMGIFVM